MAEHIPQSTSYELAFKAFLTTTGAEATGKTVAITISKAGATSFSNPSGGATNATEIGNGWYFVTLTTSDTGTLGRLAVRGTASGCDDVGVGLFVVLATNGGMTALPDTAVTTNGSLITSGTSTAQLSVSGGVAQADLAKILTEAVSTSTAQLGVNVVNIKGTASAGAAGYVGLDWGNITAPTTTVTFSGTTIGAVTGAVGSVTGAVGSVGTGGIVAATFASGALDAVWSTSARILTAGTNIVLPSNGLSAISAWTVAITGNLSGSVGSVTSRVTANVDQIDGASWSTHASGMAPADLRDIKGSASVGDAGYVGIDWAQIANPTAVEALTNTTTSSTAPTVAQIATAVWQDTTAGDFTVSGSIGKSLFTSGAVPGAAGGLFIAGTNAATTVSFTGSLSGSVGSVSGNVGGNVVGSVASVSGNVGGNVVGSVASVTAGVTLAGTAVQAIWDALTSVLTTAGSIGKLLVDNVNATISSRLASASYTAPPSAATVASAVWDTTLASHVAAGSTGQALSTASGGGTAGPDVNVITWLGDTPNGLIGGRVEAIPPPPPQKWTG